MSNTAITVIICARNEARRIERAIASLKACEPDHILVVDGGSTDDTVELAQREGVEVILSGGKGLAYDRQLGADRATTPLIAYVDADHRPAPDAIGQLISDIEEFGLDIVQAGVGIEENGFWNTAENQAMQVFQHQPGPRTAMIGTAPAVYRREVLQTVRFDEHNRLQSDDADLFRRIVETGKYTFGVGRAIVPQEHHSSTGDYLSKFWWYGKRDAEFMAKHPERIHSMLFHLLVRYPIWRPAKALISNKLFAIPYFWTCAGTRLLSLTTHMIRTRCRPGTRRPKSVRAPEAQA